jgi:ornithine carbamoyltransferase
MAYPKDFLSITDLSSKEIRDLIGLARELKSRQKEGRAEPLLRGKVLAMIFHKPSLRTRVSFEVAMIQAGGAALYITEPPCTSPKRRSGGETGSRCRTSRAFCRVTWTAS